MPYFKTVLLILVKVDPHLTSFISMYVETFCTKRPQVSALRMIQTILVLGSYPEHKLHPLHAKPQTFENSVFTRSENASIVFHPYYAEKFKNGTVTGHFGSLFEENSDREIIYTVIVSIFKVLRFRAFSNSSGFK